jgi:hypothetical protein
MQSTYTTLSATGSQAIFSFNPRDKPGTTKLGSTLCFLHHDMAADAVPIWSFRPPPSGLQANVAVYSPRLDVLKILRFMHELFQSRIIGVVELFKP